MPVRRKAAKPIADVGRQGPHIRSLAARNFEYEAAVCKIAVVGKQAQFMDADATRFPLDFDAGPGILVQGLAIALQCRIHRRHLVDLADKGRQHFFHLRNAARYRTTLQHTAFGIGRVGGNTELHCRHIPLVGIEQLAGKLGRFAKAQGQKAGRQRIERSGMPRLLGAIEAACRL
jgi:hypothetical protein